jgi:hypothetical protein
MQNSKVAKSLTLARQHIDIALAGLGTEAKQSAARRTPAVAKTRATRKAA